MLPQIRLLCEYYRRIVCLPQKTLFCDDYLLHHNVGNLLIMPNDAHNGFMHCLLRPSRSPVAVLMPTLHSTVCIACWSAVPVKGSTTPHSSRCTQRHSHHNHRRHSRQTRRRSRRSQTEIATFRALNSAHKLSTTNFVR